MDFQKLKRNSLKQKIVFRGMCFFVALILLSVMYSKSFQSGNNSVVENILIGLGVSLLVLSTVDLWDLSVEVYAQCINERINFFEIIKKNYFEQICIIKENLNIFKQKQQTANNENDEVAKMWEVILDKFLEMRKQLCEEAFSMKYYLLTEEYDKIWNYIEHCVFLLNSCLCGEPQDVNKLCNEFIIRRNQKHEGKEQLGMFEKKLNEANEIAKAHYQLRSIELNDKKLKIPDAIFEENRDYVIDYEEIINFSDLDKSKFEETIFAPADYIYNRQSGEKSEEFSGFIKAHILFIRLCFSNKNN